ncbi:MAG TPA: hypothetical protein VOA19_07830, partial [Actinomycetes bacterium]|nr:hypothetical protein [Actinomycetes bacterium]
MSSVEVAEEPVAGGDVLEPLTLQAHGCDAGWGRGEELVAVELPGVAGDPKGEGLAGPGPPDDQGDTLAALAKVAHHGLLVGTGGGMGGQGPAHRLMQSHGGVFARPT